MWNTPRTEWMSINYYNIEDWQRVRSNLEHLRDVLLEKGFIVPSLLITDTGRGYDELPHVYLVNNMEQNLDELRKAFGVDFTEDVAPKTWYERLDSMYVSNPTYQDWSRWELLLLRVYESIQFIDNYMFTPICGACHCGSERTLIRFSKGR